ncbi:MAG: class II aldolase/adducin family protein [Pseudomonadota bacterium]
MPPEADSLLSDLEQLSARLAEDPLLVQAGGGNTSVKDGDVLWVKASGCWLADAGRRAIFVAVDRDGNPVARGAPGASLRPSIETALHLAMPQRFVVHLHAANSAVASILADGEERFARAMTNGPQALFLSYAKPGEALARQVSQAMAGRPGVQAILLQNHGLVIGADSAHAALELIEDIEARLQFQLSEFAGNISEPAPEGYVPVSGSGIFLASPELRKLLFEPYFPDQVVFLHQQIALRNTMPGMGREAPPAAVLIEDRGVYVRSDADPGQKAVLNWLVELARRIPPGAELIALPPGAAVDLLGWDAEHHRRSIDRARS